MKLENKLYLKTYDVGGSQTDLDELPLGLKPNRTFAFDISGRHNFPIKNEAGEPVTLFSFEEGGTVKSVRRNIKPRAEIEVLTEEHYQDPHYGEIRTRGEYIVKSVIGKK